MLVRLLANATQYKAEMRSAGRTTDDTTKSIQRQSTVTTQASKDLDRYSGRLRIFAEAGAVFGPGLIPLSGAAITTLASLASGLVATAGAAGTMLLALHGVGDGLKALDKYQLEPTADNLEKVRQAFDKLGPSGEHFVRYLDQIEPELKSLQMTARDGMLPGFEESIDALLSRAPQVQRIIQMISEEVGGLAADAGEGLAGPRFSAFFSYLEHDAVPILDDFVRSLGNVAEGSANLLVAFTPASEGFSQGLLDMTSRFAEWSRTLDDNQSFQDFLDYLDRTGPQALAFLGSLSDALVGVTTAAAPWGEVLLPALSELLDLTTSLANSPLGTPLFTAAAGMIALNRASSMLRPGLSSLSDTFLDLRTSPDKAATAVQRFGGVAKAAAGAAGMGLFVHSLGETNKSLGLLEGAAGGAMAGFAVGGPWGAAIGGAVGGLAALASGNKDTSGYIDALTASLNEQTGALTGNSRAVAAKALEEAGALKTAQDLGINLDIVTSAALGNKDALAAVNTELEKFTNVETPAGVDKELFKQREAGDNLRRTLVGLAGDTDSTIASAKRMTEATRHSGVALQGNSLQVQRNAEALKGLVSAMEDQRTAALGAFDAETQYREALKAAAAQAKKNNAGIADNTKASLNNRATLSQLAGAWNNQSAAVKNNVGRWREAKGAFIDTATAMGVPIAKAKALADRLLEIPRSVVIRMEANADPAIKAARLLAQAIRNIPTQWQTDYIINTMRTGTKPELHAPAGNGATGTTVPKGGPYVDKHLYLLAPGEEVVSNSHGQADAHRGLLKAISARKLANGGTTGDPLDNLYATHTSTSGPSGLSSSASHAASSLNALSAAAKKELAGRKAMWQHEIARDQKALDASQKQVDLDKQKRDAIVEEIKSIREEISARYKSEIFGQGGSPTGLLNTQDVALPDNFQSASPEEQASMIAGQRAMMEALAQFNQATMDRDAAANSPINILKQNIRDARKAKRLEHRLKKAGIHGDALLYAEGHASLAEQQALAADPSLAKQYQNLYGTREQVTRSAGQFAAMQHDGKQLAAIRKTLEADRADRDQDRAVLNAAKNHLANIDKTGPERTGQAAGRSLGNVLNHATGHGLRHK